MPSLKKNLIYHISYQVLILIVPFITTPYVSRVLGPEGVGQYAVTTAIVKYFTLFALLGMANYGNRTIAKNRADKETLSVAFWNLFYFQLGMSLITTTAYIAYALTAGEVAYGLVSICQIPYILSAVFEVSWFFYGMEDFKSIVLRNAAVKVLTTIAIFLFVDDRTDVWLYALINALSLLVGQLCLWPFLRRYVVWKKPQWRLMISHLKPNCILMVSVIAVSLYTLMDKIMIEWLANTAEVGYYENTEKILTIANNAAGAIGAVMLPRLSNLRYTGKSDQILKYIDKSMKYIMLLAIALAFGAASISKTFSVLYFGWEFEKCGTLIFMIAPAIIFYAWSNIIRTQFLLPNDMDKVFVIATVTAAGVNFVLNGVLIPIYGALGAVLGTVGAQLVELGYQMFRIRKALPQKKYVVGALPYISAGVLMFISVRQIETHMGMTGMSLLLQICTGAVIYSVLVLLYLYITRDELVTGFIHRF